LILFSTFFIPVYSVSGYIYLGRHDKEKEKEKQLCLALLRLLCFLANWKENCFVGGEMVEQER
jgi:hypothetical protein